MLNIGINCAQLGQTMWEQSGTNIHTIHMRALYTLPKQKSSPCNSTANTGLYTQIMHINTCKITDVDAWFSTSSTPPITIITI